MTFHSPRRLLVIAALISAISGCSYLPFGPAETEVEAKSPAKPTISVDISGVDGDVRDNIQHSLTVARRACDTPHAYLRALAASAESEAQSALRAFGYYDAQISATIEAGTTCPIAKLSVSPGRRIKIAALDIKLTGDAANDPTFAKRLASAPLALGDGLNHQHYTTTKGLLESVALERGYLDGHYTQSTLKVDPTAGTAAIALTYDAGHRYTIGKIDIAQSPHFIDEELVRRFLDYTPGQAYEAATITRFYRALATSDYFSDVEVRPLLSSPNADAIPIAIALSPRPRHKFGAGIGASTDELIRGKLTYANRHVNEYGHRLTAELKSSVIEQSLTGQYQIPQRHPSDEWLSVNVGVRREDVDAFNTLEAQVGVSETRRRRWNVMETHFVNLNQQSFDVGAQTQGTSTLLIPGVSWSKVTTDDALYPQRGYSATLEIRGAAEPLLSDTSFTRVLFSGHFVRALPLRSRILLRTDLGGMWVDRFAQLPPSERFFAGGDVSIRGYDIDALGPRDNGNAVVGGSYLGVASVELEKTIRGNWAVAGFVDAGNAFGGDGRDDGIKTGVGLGLRWRSPVGPVRIDLAHPLDASTAVRLHLRIGPDL